MASSSPGTKCHTVRFQRLCGIFHACDMHAINAAGFATRHRHLSTNDVGQSGFLFIGGLFCRLAQACGAFATTLGASGTGSSAQDIEASRWILLNPART
jgi:hypothetical protein